MPQSLMTQPSDPTPGYAEHHPLLPGDPVRVGDFQIGSRPTESPAGVVYCVHVDDSDPVILIHLRDGAASDPAARARFSGEISAMHIDIVAVHGGQNQDEGRMAVRLWDEDDDPIAISHRPLVPWVALASSGSPEAVAEAQRVLTAVDLVYTPQLGSLTGPDFQMHWQQSIYPGTWRMWPLSRSDRKDRADWLSLLTSLLLMLLIASVAMLLAILVFQSQQRTSPPTPVPSSEPIISSGSGSGSPNQSSGELSSGELSSRESSELEGRSDTPLMEQPSGDSSGPGSPSPEHELQPTFFTSFAFGKHRQRMS